MLHPKILLPFALTLLATLASGETSNSKRTVLFVSQPTEASWQDFAFLAAVPASRMANHGNGAAIALDETGTIPREVEDYLRRLKPEGIFHLGAKPMTAAPQIGKLTEMPCTSAEDAANQCATTFWSMSHRVVLCRDDDYASALIASSLASRHNAPLLFCGEQGLSKDTSEVIAKLHAQEKLFVGRAPEGLDATESLPDVQGVLKHLKQHRLYTPYFALANTRDRTSTTVRKLSLAAPIFAAAHYGLVVPVDDEIHWRVPFYGKPIQGDPPKGIQKGSKSTKAGIIDLPEGKVPFVLSTGNDHLLYLDLNGDGNFDGPNEGPLRSDGVVSLLGKPRTLDFCRKMGTDADLTVTTGSAEQIVAKLRALYAATNIPEYLCIVGFPDTIPQAILSKGDTDMTSDLPYGNADKDLFSEIAVGRIIGESATFATLHASRTVTYDALLDPSWSSRAGQARWETTMSGNFENIGLDASAYHDEKRLAWAEPPSQGKKGKKAGSFSQDSPLTNVAFLTHTAHSWWKDLGQTYDMNSSTLLSPSVIESGGCLTCKLDYEPGFHSVVARMLRNGAISFTGQTREGIAEQEQERAEFWNAVLTGASIGEAHKRALNSTAAVVLETGQLRSGPQHYQLHIRSLFGDPAFVPHLPAPSKSAPAGFEIKVDTVTVHAPAKWMPVRIRVPEDWKLWADKPLYVLRGAGTYPIRSWCREQYDREETFADAEFTTTRKIKSITQMQTPTSPLGWNGKHTIDENPDGSHTYHWRVRLADFDQTTGVIKAKLDRIDYHIEFES